MYLVIKIKRGWAVQNSNTFVVSHTCKTEAEANRVAEKLNAKG